MRATCIDNFAQPGLELNKEYEVEELKGETITLKELPFVWPVKLFKVEGSLFDIVEIEKMKSEVATLDRDIDRLEDEIWDLESERDDLEEEREQLVKNIKALGGKI